MKDKEISVEIGNNILVFKTKLMLSKESIEKERKEIIEQIKSGIVVIDGRFELDVIKKAKKLKKEGL